MRLKDKVAIVTGGGSGFGAGICAKFVAEGAQVIVADLNLDAALDVAARLGAAARALRVDVADATDVRLMMEAAELHFGHLDILVNNAGVGGSEKPILKMTEEDWDNTVATDLRGIFVLSQAVAKTMVEKGEGGKVINVASIGAQIIFPNMSAYCSSKGGVLQLTKVMALEWIRHNIQVNAILPGYFETPMNTHFFATEVGKKIIKKNIPQNRLGQMDDMKGLAVYLASPASNFMTGSALVIDGGQVCW